MGVTSMFLGGLSSDLHQNGVPQEILRIGQYPRLIGSKNGRFLAILGLNSTVSPFTLSSRGKWV